MEDFKITCPTDSAMRRLGIPGRSSAKTINDTLDVEVEPLMAFLPRKWYERDI